MDNKYLWWFGGGLLVVAVLGFAIGRWSVSGSPVSGGTGQQASVPVPEVNKALTSVYTKEAVPAGTVIPGVGSSVPANVAAPTVVQPVNTKINTGIQYRAFSLTIANGAFSPDTIIVRSGDVAHITITAADADYDFTQPDYGLRVGISKGQTKVVESQLSTPGKFTFYCGDCGGPDKGPKGYIIVTQ